MSARLETILARNDPENDYTPGTPLVTWAEADLAEVVAVLEHQIDALRSRVDRLEEALQEQSA